MADGDVYSSYQKCIKGELKKKQLESNYRITLPRAMRKCGLNKWKKLIAFPSKSTISQVKHFQKERAKKEAKLVVLEHDIDELNKDIIRWFT